MALFFGFEAFGNCTKLMKFELIKVLQSVGTYEVLHPKGKIPADGSGQPFWGQWVKFDM